MFDIGFSELIVIGLVALVVVGPKRLPVATRTIGTLLGRAQRYVNDVKSDIQRQVDLEELRKVQKQFETVGEEIKSGVQAVEKEVGTVTSDLSSATAGAFEDFGEPPGTASDKTFGLYINAPEPSWSEKIEHRRVRERVRNRLRRRYHTKVVRD